MLNTVIITGRLTADPELNTGSSGTDYLNFSIACERDYKAEGKDCETDFIDLRAFKGTATFISKYFKKGDMIQVAGRLQRDVWDDKETGKKRSKIVIVVNNAYFCGSKNTKESTGTGYTSEAQTYADAPMYEITDDDGGLPF